MAPRSSIDLLPDTVRHALERRLTDTGFGNYSELTEWLNEQGYQISRSAVHRYGRKLDRRLSAIRASTEAAKMIQAHAGDDKDARSEALTAMVQTELFEAILALQEADELDADGNPPNPGDRVALLSKAAKNIATLTRSSVNLKQFQAKVEEAARKQLLDEQRAKLEAMPSKGGVTPETKAAIREALGIT